MYCAKRCLQLADPLLRSGFHSLKAVAAPPSITRALCSPAALPAWGDVTSTRTKSHGPADSHGRLQRTADLLPNPGRGKNMSMFAAGRSKRIAEMLRTRERKGREDQEAVGRPRQTMRDQVEAPDRPLSVAEWRQLKEAAAHPERFDKYMMKSLLTSGAELDIAKSLLTFVATETGTLSYELLLQYLTLSVRDGHDGEAADVYEIMRARFPMLETGACSLFVQSFSRTPRWREALDILRHVNKINLPSAGMYGRVIAGAVAHGDWATAWELYGELFTKGLVPLQDTWEVLFRGAASGTRSEAEQDGTGRPGRVTQSQEQQQRLLAILHYMRDNQVYPQQGLVHAIKTWFESPRSVFCAKLMLGMDSEYLQPVSKWIHEGQQWKAGWTTINPEGLCRCCGSLLESIHLNTEEYHQLKDVVMTSIIQGRDVFKKTTPEELNRFKEFVKQRPAFDVVLDGLNVACLTRDHTLKSKTLLAVVSELERRGQVVLVLGRKHMLSLRSQAWDRQTMKLVQNKAHCFFTDDISEDDPFLLYAALHSGNHCRFVSRDLMRDHKALLLDGGSRRLFFKWQRGHQMVTTGRVTPNGRVSFLSIPGHDTVIQTWDNTWHIPYDDSVEERTCHEVPQRWLCLTKTH